MALLNGEQKSGETPKNIAQKVKSGWSDDEDEHEPSAKKMMTTNKECTVDEENWDDEVNAIDLNNNSSKEIVKKETYAEAAPIQNVHEENWD
jgi:hypothetical protein